MVNGGGDLNGVVNARFLLYPTPPDVTPFSVPEPTTILLIGAGLIGVAVLRRKFKK
jgi:hypothetical protein